MIGMKVIYEGDLHCEAVHLKSGSVLTTDAPPDNHGKGESFSPTDLLCTSLGTCFITIMGITAAAKGIHLGKIEATIEKIMAENPRRVDEIKVDLTIENKDFTQREMEILKNAALNCPVTKSLHPDIKQVLNFNFLPI
jgi:putative redox protein